jgi:hypothetical protein
MIDFVALSSNFVSSGPHETDVNHFLKTVVYFLFRSCCLNVFCYYYILSYFVRFLFYKNMVVIYVFLLEEAMYCYCCLCILIVSLCYSCLCVVYVFLDAATLRFFRAFSSVVREMPG